MTKQHNLTKQALEAAQAPWGEEWKLLTEDHREALIAREAVYLLLAQDESLDDKLTLGDAKRIVSLAMGRDVPQEDQPSNDRLLAAQLGPVFASAFTTPGAIYRLQREGKRPHTVAQAKAVAALLGDCTCTVVVGDHHGGLLRVKKLAGADRVDAYLLR